MLRRMSRMAEPIVLSPDERATLSTWAHGRRFPLRLVQRARIIQMAADGILESAHRPRLAPLPPDGAAVAPAISGSSLCRIGTGRPAPWTDSKNFGAGGSRGGRSDPPHDASRCDPLEYPQHGRGARAERGHHPPHLETTSTGVVA